MIAVHVVKRRPLQLFKHHSDAPPAMLGDAFSEAGYDVEVLALPDIRSETAELGNLLTWSFGFV